jgi:hypothetical protein
VAKPPPLAWSHPDKLDENQLHLLVQARRGKQAAWATGALLAYALIGFLLLPWILHRVLPEQAGQLLGRQVTIEQIRISPFALSGSLQGLKIKDLDGTLLLSWDEVYGNFQLSSVFHRAFTFREARVVKPYVHVQINPDYSFNISDILRRIEDRSAQRPPEENRSVPALRVERLQITNAAARVSDLTLRMPFHRQIGPLNLVIRKFHTHPDNENPYSIAGSMETGERFAWSGRFFLSPLRSEGELHIDNVRLANYAPLYQDFVSLNLSDGLIDLAAHYRFEYGGTNHFLAVSNAAFHLANLKDSATTDSTANALALGDMKVAGVEADLWNRSARIKSVTVRDGEILVRRNRDQTINLIQEVGVEPGRLHLTESQQATPRDGSRAFLQLQ